jgi:hypothetical protein
MLPAKRHRVAGSPPSEFVYSDPCQDLPSQAIAPPQPVVECVEVSTHEWLTDRTQFALLDDGSVWTWHHRVGIAPGLNLACQSVIAGGLLGTGIVGAMWITRRNRAIH